ncbi:protein kinase [Vitiosangium sp. GDMCC 1.1324]|uniref:protein kinase domain-containing protein n=1 Tax=Vitiosangium sp. (strain GDMCC 1.1324) TaxID=2138576 RepID=UPI003515BA07
MLSQLSVGGMAELFLGFTSGPGGFRKYVALKRILPDARGDEQFEQMFLDEARITAALNHPNIGQVFELGQDAEGLFLAMEFIAGQNLNQIARLCTKQGRPLPLGFSLSVVRDVCLALHYAHGFTTPGGKPSPVIHRDVAQKNVMVTYDGVVKLLDFGIAKARDGVVRTQAGMVKGTTGYMSPEQVRGESLDGRSDLFAAGVMLHEMLTGQRLFSGNSEHQEMKMILDAPIPVPTEVVPEVPPEVSAVVLKALARKREERYPNGREMARAMEAAAGKLLFDAEQRAAFMQEHFRERMEVTRRLLESADEVKAPPGASGEAGMGQAPTEPAGPVKQGARPEKAEVRSTTRDEGARVQTREEPKRPAPQEQGARREREADTQESPAAGVVTTGRRVTRERPALEPVKEPRSTTKQAQGGRGKFWGVISVLLVLGGGLGFAAVKLIAAIKEQEASGTPIPVGDLSPMLPIERPGQKTGPKTDTGAKTDTGLAAGTSAAKTQPPADAQEGGKGASANKDGDGEPVRKVKQGALTLIVLPEAEVFLNGRSLGKTPLIKTPVPVGRHRLRIKGADGKRRELSVPIEAGKTAQFKLALTDIPEH